MLARRDKVEHRQQDAQRRKHRQLLAPCRGGRAQQGMHQGQQPQRKENAQLPIAAMRNPHRHQSVGPEKANAGDAQSRDRRHIERFDQTVDARSGAAELTLVLGAALHHEQNRPGGHHCAASQATHEVQPLERPTTKREGVQSADHRLRQRGVTAIHIARQANREHLARLRREHGHAGGGAQTVTCTVFAVPTVNANARGRIARVVDHHGAHRLLHQLLAAQCKRLQIRHLHGLARALGFAWLIERLQIALSPRTARAKVGRDTGRHERKP